MLNTQEFIYTLDMFRDTLHLPVETPDNLFVAPVNIETIEKFPEIPQRIEEDYHSIKDDIPLEIRATDDFKEYEMVFMSIDVPMNQPQPVVSTQGTHRCTPRAHRTPTLTASPQGKKRKQSVRELSDEGEESYASKFADSVINDDVDDFGARLEPGSHKENTKHVHDDDVEIEKEKKDDVEIDKENKDDVVIEKEKKDDEEIEKEKNNDNVEDTDKVVKEKDIVDDVTGSIEIRKEQKQTPIPSPTRSPRNVSSSDKTVSEELTATASPTTATTSKASSTIKCKKQSISFRSKTLPGSIVGMCRRRSLDHCNKVVHDTTFAKTKEMITQEMPRMVNLVVNKDHEVDSINAQEMLAKEFATHRPKMIEELFRKHMQNTTHNLYPTTSTSTAGKSSADLQHKFYLNMKSKPQDQAADPKI
ncbi:hypothetical protein Tco_1421875 [Tanacetum coccineum]